MSKFLHYSMSAILVPAVKTTYNQSDLIKGLIEGWTKEFNSIPQKKSIGVIYAQNALETGGTVSMWNNNIGNVKYVPSANTANDDGIKYMMLTNVWEMIKGQKVIFQPPNPSTWFRSFDTITDGAAFHLDFLKNHHYKSAWSAIEMGDPAQFAHLLKVGGYYTAAEADYIKAINRYFDQYMKSNTFENVLAAINTPIADKPNSIISSVVNIFNNVFNQPKS